HRESRRQGHGRRLRPRERRQQLRRLDADDDDGAVDGTETGHAMKQVPEVPKVPGVLVLAVLAVLGATARAQSPEPAPRWPDGNVNLGSTPDKKGYWEVRRGLAG